MKELGVIGKNTAWQLFGKGLGTAISMVTIFLIIRMLGPINYGTFALLTTIMNLFYMFGGLGTESSMAYFLSKYKNSQFDLLKKFLKARVALIILSSLILFLSINFIADYYNNPGLKNYLPLVVFSMPFFILMNVAPGILQGLNNLKTTSIADLIFNVAKIAAIPLVIYLGLTGGLIGYLFAYVCYILYAYKQAFKLSKKNEEFNKYSEFAKFSLINYVGTITIFLSNGLLPLILGKMPLELGYLDAASRVGMIMTLASTALLTALVPSIVGKKVEEIKTVSSKIMNYILIYVVPLLMFFFFASSFAANLLLGSEFSGIYALIKIVSVMFFFNIVSSLFEIISYSIGKNKYPVIGNVIRLVVILAFSSYAINAFNSSLIMLFAAGAVLVFMAVKARKYYRIDFKSAGKIVLFSLPLMLFFSLDMNLILKIMGSFASSLLYLFLVWKKVLDDVDRDLFIRFMAKMKSVVWKK
ncbi:MAG: oligosaccharide flippase family protein [Candidatus Nanoarchaeia archaeon]|jgi:O-antigen/teichoic acid export membrane protein